MTQDTHLITTLIGSRAYGLHTPDSDRDYITVYATPTQNLFTLNPSQFTLKAKTTFDPDTTHFEVLKFINTTLKCNPTALQVLYADPESAGKRPHPLFEELIEQRDNFLSSIRIRKVFTSCIYSDLKSFNQQTDPDKRKKVARNVVRILIQLDTLLQTSYFQVNVSPARNEIFQMAEQAYTHPYDFEFTIHKLIDDLPSKDRLPKEQNIPPIQDWLIRLRKELL